MLGGPGAVQQLFKCQNDQGKKTQGPIYIFFFNLSFLTPPPPQSELIK